MAMRIEDKCVFDETLTVLCRPPTMPFVNGSLISRAHDALSTSFPPEDLPTGGLGGGATPGCTSYPTERTEIRRRRDRPCRS